MNSQTENIFKLNSKSPETVISIVDESLEMKKDIRCDLLSCISSSGISLALLDRKKNKFLALEVLQHEKPMEEVKHFQWLREISHQSDLLKNHTFSTTHVAIVNELTTMVPSALFKKEDAEKYFQFNFNVTDVIVHSERVRAFDTVNAFGYSKQLHETIHTVFKSPVIHHHVSALLEGHHLSIKKSSGRTLLANIRNGNVDLIVTEGKKLIFINSFSFQNYDDLVYYVLFVCDRLQLDPELIPVFVTGEVEKSSALYHLLGKYIRNIDFASRSDVFNFSYGFVEIPAHYYFNLFSLALCES